MNRHRLKIMDKKNRSKNPMRQLVTEESIENKQISFMYLDETVRQGVLITDDNFWGGYKILSDNLILSIKSVIIVLIRN
jgi:hypothetical protein